MQAVMAEPVAEAVPLDAVPGWLLRDAPFQSGADWWGCVIGAALPPRSAPHLLLARAAGRPTGLLALRVGPRQALTGLVSPYTCLFQPVVAPGTDPAALGRAFGRACAGWPVLRLDALDAGWPGWPGLLAGFAAAGWRAAWFDSFGNWHADAAGGWDAYLAARPGALRETIRRKLRRVERDPAVTFTLARETNEALAELAAYDAVYRRSWKQPEPCPDFGAAFVAAAAKAGVLRIGVLRQAGQPVAAQYWTIEYGVATVHKLAHDEAAKALSPGTILTAWMVRRLLAEGATRLDFGRGDDPYKRLWADARRQRKGLILARPWRPSGAAALLRQAAGGALRRGRAGGVAAGPPADTS
jgi:CelD/BcsL family acetyltransferase involved in cellulose biosynthesis